MCVGCLPPSPSLISPGSDHDHPAVLLPHAWRGGLQHRLGLLRPSPSFPLFFPLVSFLLPSSHASSFLPPSSHAGLRWADGSRIFLPCRLVPSPSSSLLSLWCVLKHGPADRRDHDLLPCSLQAWELRLRSFVLVKSPSRHLHMGSSTLPCARRWTRHSAVRTARWPRCGRSARMYKPLKARFFPFRTHANPRRMRPILR
jgi:hypothetical protein